MPAPHQLISEELWKNGIKHSVMRRGRLIKISIDENIGALNKLRFRHYKPPWRGNLEEAAAQGLRAFVSNLSLPSSHFIAVKLGAFQKQSIASYRWEGKELEPARTVSKRVAKKIMKRNFDVLGQPRDVSNFIKRELHRNAESEGTRTILVPTEIRVEIKRKTKVAERK